IKGEVKVLPLADSPGVFSGLKKIYIDGAEYRIISARIADGVYLFLRGIADRSSAEELRDKEIFADRADIPLPDDRWFVTDIIGSEIRFENGEVLGRVTDITKRGSTDVYTAVLPDGKSVMFPLLKTMIVSADAENGKMVLKKDKFSEAALYED
ncbi:MAG: 16S rRNA processing protein RimM, partial [Clostridia bacterium]|nr:16S rRNA processing protein RimM [Clostridia bacterium]